MQRQHIKQAFENTIQHRETGKRVAAVSAVIGLAVGGVAGAAAVTMAGNAVAERHQILVIRALAAEVERRHGSPQQTLALALRMAGATASTLSRGTRPRPCGTS